LVITEHHLILICRAGARIVFGHLRLRYVFFMAWCFAQASCSGASCAFTSWMSSATMRSSSGRRCAGAATSWIVDVDRDRLMKPAQALVRSFVFPARFVLEAHSTELAASCSQSHGSFVPLPANFIS
jgi:hypothetical protein